MNEIQWTPGDREALAHAAEMLERRSFAMTVAEKVGMPVESLLKWLPAGTQNTLNTAVHRALEQCLHVALQFGEGRVSTAAVRRSHVLTTAATGALGGFFGLPGLAIELPVTTTVMLHSIAGIARAQGEDLSQPDAALACLEVLALGPEGSPKEAGAMESAYYATRAALAQVTREAAAYMAQKGVVKEGAPVLVGFIARVAARFGLEVSEKAAAQLVPVAGAAGGLALNVLFTQHFQRIAQGHFTVRRLERTYGSESVRAMYEVARSRIEA